MNGIGGGFQGVGSKTVIPREAFAKLTCRLVPPQEPRDIAAKVKAHLEAHAPRGVRVEVTGGHGGEPYLTDPHSTFGQAAQRALRTAFPGKDVALIREGGSIPIVNTFKKVLGVETLLLGLALPDCRAHAPDENFPLENFFAGIRLNRALLAELAATRHDDHKRRDRQHECGLRETAFPFFSPRLVASAFSLARGFGNQREAEDQAAQAAHHADRREPKSEQNRGGSEVAAPPRRSRASKSTPSATPNAVANASAGESRNRKPRPPPRTRRQSLPPRRRPTQRVAAKAGPPPRRVLPQRRSIPTISANSPRSRRACSNSSARRSN